MSDLILVNHVVFVFLYNTLLNDKFSCSDMALFLKNVPYARPDSIFYLTARKQTPTKPRVCILCPLKVCFGSTMTDSARADPSRPKLTQSGHIESIYRFQKQAMQ